MVNVTPTASSPSRSAPPVSPSSEAATHTTDETPTSSAATASPEPSTSPVRRSLPRAAPISRVTVVVSTASRAKMSSASATV